MTDDQVGTRDELEDDDLVAALENGVLSEDVDDEPAVPRGPRPDVASVLEEIGAEEAVAHLEARIAEMEQELERRDHRRSEADRARRGEFDLMRARIDDALDLVKNATDEQRDAWSRFEARFTALVAESEETAQVHLDELREELTPRVADVLVRLEEQEAKLRGELRTLASEQERLRARTTEQLSEVESGLRTEVTSLSDRLSAQDDGQTETANRLERLLQERLEHLESSQSAATDELTARLEGLRRELDAAAGELRAAVNLKHAELSGGLEELREDLDGRLGEEVDGLEQRWIVGTRDIARRIEEVSQDLQRQLSAEREARRGGLDEATTRLDEVAGVVEELHAAFGTAQARRHGEDDQVQRQLEELSSRLDVLQSKVASAVGQIASQLTNRVAALSAQQDAFQEAAARREERLAAIDTLERGLSVLTEEVRRLRSGVEQRPVPEPDPELVESVQGVRRQLSSMSGTVEATSTQLRDLASTIERLDQEAQERAALRQEVRELAARSAEIGERLDETERLARAAGKAIASAVRRSRSAQQRQQDERQPSFFQREPSEQQPGLRPGSGSEGGTS